ncbi:MAG: flagellin, partial [Desulfovibrio desulfuricans]|nr:flagellin [Desulfovibrio desulfuricans]
MYLNHNLMAANVSNNLTAHYSNLQTSTQRLSTGLRVNSAADDAAGLAIRELMRTDIAALNQGVRNANDAISLI